MQEAVFSGKWLPVILQSETADCGLACLAMIACHHGHRLTASELRRRFPVSAKGIPLRGIMETADTLGLTSRPLRVEISALSKVRCPAILHWDLSHYIVLKRVGRRHIDIHDPSLGFRRLTIGEASKHFTGVVLELTPGRHFHGRKSGERLRLGDLWSDISGFWPSFVQMLLLSLLLQAIALLLPVANQVIIDDVLTKGDADLLTMIAIGMILLMTAQMGTNILRNFISLHLGTLLSFQLSGNLLRHLLRLPVGWFEKRHLGDIVSRFNALKPVQDFLTGGTVAVVLDGVMAAATLVMMLIYSPALTVVVAGSCALLLLGRAAAFPRLRRLTEEGVKAGAHEQSLFLETIRGIRTLKIAGRELSRFALWQNAHAVTLNAGLRCQRFGIAGTAFGTLVGGLETTAILYFGAREVMDSRLTLGMLLAFQSYRGHFDSSASALLTQWFSYRMLGLHFDRLADIVHEEGEPLSQSGAAPAAPHVGAIALHGAGVRYGAHDPWILRNVDLEIEPGAFVVFVGPSGGGKTTLLKLLMGMHPPSEGGVLVDGLPLGSIGLHRYRERIGAVMQDDQLFAGTLADNIALFDPEIDMERVEEAARMAAIHRDIMRMPMGFMTLAGDLGSALSAGQRQRLLLARALYSRPAFLFLDEGTANLDPHSERKIMSALARLSITRIAVAHRPLAIEGADRIYLVNHGRVVSLTAEAMAGQAPYEGFMPQKMPE